MCTESISDNDVNRIFEDLDTDDLNDEVLDNVLHELENNFSQGKDGNSDSSFDLDILDINDLCLDDLFEAATVEVKEQDVNCEAIGSVLNSKDMEHVLCSLQTSSEKLHGKWKGISSDTFMKKFENAPTINKQFTLEDLKICTKVLKEKLQNKEINTKSLHYKADYVNLYSQLLGDHSSMETKKKKDEMVTKKVKSFKAFLNLKLKKSILANILCILKWVSVIKSWKEQAFFSDTCKVDGTPYPDQWYTQPEILDGKPVFSFLDFHHLLTNTRCHIARHGYPDAGINRDEVIYKVICFIGFKAA